jgi:hypothetical protein
LGGTGTSSSAFIEGHFAYLAQMLRPDETPVGPAELPYLPTATGGRVLELTDRAGNLDPRKSAYVTTRGAARRSMLEAVLTRSKPAEASLEPIIRRRCDASVHEARMAGRLIHPQAARQPA